MKTTKRKLEFARRMRKNPTRGEAVLWEELRYFRYAKCRFKRQEPMCGFILDFYCPSRRLAVEVDGSAHYGRERQDAYRQRVIERENISFIRFTNAQVLHRLQWVLEEIGKACRAVRRHRRKPIKPRGALRRVSPPLLPPPPPRYDVSADEQRWRTDSVGIPLKTCEYHPKVRFDGPRCPGCQAEREIPTPPSVDAILRRTLGEHRSVHSFHRTHNNKIQI
jgi:very-short-patch-repair endonuclease